MSDNETFLSRTPVGALNLYIFCCYSTAASFFTRDCVLKILVVTKLTVVAHIVKNQPCKMAGVANYNPGQKCWDT